MTKITLLALFFYSGITFSYSSYMNDSIEISPEIYRRYILPQLKSIVSDFLTFTKRVSTESASAPTDIAQLALDIDATWKTVGIKHSKKMKILTKKLNTFDQKLLQQFHKKIEKLYTSKNQDFPLLQLRQNYSKIMNEGLKLTLLLNHEENIENSPFQKEWTINPDIEKSLQQINVLTPDIVFAHIDSKKIKKECAYLWHSFIRPIVRYSIYKKSIPIFRQKLFDLDMRWNTFHKIISREDIRIKNTQLKPLKDIHMRWNRILKLVVR